MARPVAFYRLITTGDQISRAHGQNGTRRVILAEPVGAVDGEELREPRARAIEPALDRAYRALADHSRLLAKAHSGRDGRLAHAGPGSARLRGLKRSRTCLGHSVSRPVII